MSPVLECVDLTAGYGGTPVVRGLSMQVDDAEVVALLGPNGAGKTTTLLALSGLVKPISGRARAFDTDVRAGRPELMARGGLGHVPDGRAVFTGLTVFENLRLGLGPSRRRRRHGAARISTILESFPALDPLRNRRAGLLSGGEQQMLVLARALLNEPKAMMIDEMSLGLAPLIVQQLLPMARDIAHEHGTAMLIVEQHVDLALQVADRAYVLNHGELVLTGTGSELAGSRDLLQASYMGEVSDEQASPDSVRNGKAIPK